MASELPCELGPDFGQLLSPDVYALGIQYEVAQQRMRSFSERAFNERNRIQAISARRDDAIVKVQEAKLALDNAHLHLKAVESEVNAYCPQLICDEYIVIEKQLAAIERRLQLRLQTRAPVNPFLC